MKKKISIIGVVLGAVLGIIAGLMAGGWLFWLGIGLALGVVIGSAGTRRSRLQRQRGSRKFSKQVKSSRNDLEELWHY